MSITRLIICSLLAVLPLTSVAAPNTSTTYETTPLSAEPDPLLTNVAVESMVKPPRHSLLLAAGYAGGSYIDADEWVNGYSFVLRYAHIPQGVIEWDYGFEVNKENIVGLSAGRRWYCCPGDKFDPYARVSVGTFVDGFSELAGFVDLSRWRVRGSLGLGQSFTTEAGVGYALNGFDLYIQAGYVFKF